MFAVIRKLAMSVFISTVLLATAQSPDLLILNGKIVSIHTNPLEPYFELHPEKRLKEPMTVTSCWRGYIATFEFIDNRLCVNKIITQNYKNDPIKNTWITVEKDVTKEVFPGLEKKFCDWFSATLIIPQGEMTHYVHMGYGSTYENYILIRIKNGIQVDTKSFTQKEFHTYRMKKFAAFKKTPEFQQALKESLKQGGTAREAESFLFEFFTEVYLSNDF